MAVLRTILGASQFSGGVNEEDFLADLEANEVAKADNAIISRKGSLRKREGSHEYGSDAGVSGVYGMKSFTDDGGVLRKFKMVSTNLVEYNAGLWNTVVKAGLTAGLYMQMSDILCASTTASTTGTATGGSDFTLVNAGAGWSVNAYIGFVVKITSGTGSGQTKTILENSATTLNVDGRWDTAPDATSVYAIYPKVPAVICNNGTDATFKVIGVTATTLSGLPKFTSQVVIGSRLWGIVGTKIYWSDLANGEAIGSLNNIDTGETLMALGRVGDFVAVYSKTKTGIVTGTSANDFAFKWRDYAHGCVAANSVSSWKSYCFSLAQDGIYVFDGTENRFMSRKITPSIKNIKASLRSESFGFVYDNKYHLLFATDSTSTVKDKMAVMDLIWSNFSKGEGAFTFFTGINCNVMGTFPDSNGFNNLYIGKSDNSKVLQLYDGTFSDSGSGIAFKIETREFDGKLVGQMKKYMWFFYEGAVQNVASDLQVSKNIDNAGFELFATVSHLQTGGLWDVAFWDVSSFGGVSRVISRQRPGGRGRTIQYQFYNNLAAHPIEMYKFEQSFENYVYH